jgi:hypothetical protein
MLPVQRKERPERIRQASAKGTVATCSPVSVAISTDQPAQRSKSWLPLMRLSAVTTAAATASAGSEHSTPRASGMERCSRRRLRKYRGMRG